MSDRNYNDRNRPNAIERDRMERRRQVRRKSMISNALVIGVIAVVVIGIFVAVIAMTGKNKQPATADPTTVTATIAADSQTKETKAQPTQDSGLTVSQADSQDDDNNNDNNNDDNDNEPTIAPTPTEGSSSASSGSASGGGSNVMHYTASGQTSYGYDWTYEGGSGIVSIDCGYDFNSHTYDFTITGVSEGVATITLYYNTDDGVQQPVNMTVNVDSNLNVTQIG